MTAVIHIYPETARKASALDLMKYWRVYALLKHYDRQNEHGRGAGTGRFIVDADALDWLGGVLSLKAVTLRRLLRDPQAGAFWACLTLPQWRAPDTLIIELTGRVQVERTLSERAAAAGVLNPYATSRKAQLTLTDFSSLQGLAARCFDAWLSVQRDGEKRLSWANLRRAWGRSATTLRGWMDAAGVTKLANYGWMPIDGAGFTREDVALGFWFDERGYCWTGKYRLNDGTYIDAVFWNMPNTYRTSGTIAQGAKGQVKRAAAELQGSGVRPTYTRQHFTYQDTDADRKRIRKALQHVPAFERAYSSLQDALRAPVINRRAYRQARLWRAESLGVIGAMAGD
jgi:hypothetical protein